MNSFKKTILVLLLLVPIAISSAVAFAINIDKESLLMEMRNPSGDWRDKFVVAMEGYSDYGNSYAKVAFNSALNGDLSCLDRYGLTLEDLKDEDENYYKEKDRNHIIAEAIVSVNIELRKSETISYLVQQLGFLVQEAQEFYDLAVKENTVEHTVDALYLDTVLIRRQANNAYYYAFDRDTGTVLAFSSIGTYLYRGVYSGYLLYDVEMKFNADNSRWTEEIQGRVDNYVVKSRGFTQGYLEGSAKDAEEVLEKLGYDIGELLQPQKEYVAITVGCNIREKPDYGSKTIQWANAGDIFGLVERSGNWYKIELPNNQVGYVPKDRSEITN